MASCDRANLLPHSTLTPMPHLDAKLATSCRIQQHQLILHVAKVVPSSIAICTRLGESKRSDMEEGTRAALTGEGGRRAGSVSFSTASNRDFILKLHIQTSLHMPAPHAYTAFGNVEDLHQRLMLYHLPNTFPLLLIQITRSLPLALLRHCAPCLLSEMTKLSNRFFQSQS